MKAFLITYLVLQLMSTGGKLIWLSKGSFPTRTAQSEAWDVFFAVLGIAWASALLVLSL